MSRVIVSMLLLAIAGCGETEEPPAKTSEPASATPATEATEEGTFQRIVHSENAPDVTQWVAFAAGHGTSRSDQALGGKVMTYLTCFDYQLDGDGNFALSVKSQSTLVDGQTTNTVPVTIDADAQARLSHDGAKLVGHGFFPGDTMGVYTYERVTDPPPTTMLERCK